MIVVVPMFITMFLYDSLVKNVRVVIDLSKDILRKLKLMSLRNNLLHAFRRISMYVITLPHHNRYSKTHGNTPRIREVKSRKTQA